MNNEYIKSVKLEKRECEKIGYKYIGMFKYILNIIDYYPLTDFRIDNVKDKLEDLIIGLEIGNFEIIEYGAFIRGFDKE